MNKKLNKKLLNLIALCSGLTATVTLGVGGVIYSLRQEKDGDEPIDQNVLPDSVYIIENNVLMGFTKEFLADPGAYDMCDTMQIPANVTSVNGLAFYDDTKYETTIPPFIKKLTFAKGSNCSSINNDAFRASSLTSVTLPNDLTDIGSTAFGYCSSLTSIIFSEKLTTISVYAFQSCSSLVSVTFPDSLTTIERHAFSGCSSLTSVTFPSHLVNFEGAAFENCTSLSSVDFSKATNLKEINSCAFSSCSSLTSVVFPTNLTIIGSAAFSGCSSLTSVVLPSRLSWIGSGAFGGCRNLTSVSFPENLSMIESSAFSNCPNLSSITWNSWPGTIGIYDESFSGVCPNGGTVTVTNPDGYDGVDLLQYLVNRGGLPESWLPAPELPDDVYIIENNVLKGFTSAFLANPSAYRLCDTMEIPANVTSIEDNAFYKNRESTIPSFITKLTFAEGSVCSTIGSYVFNSSPLTSVTLPDSLTTIGSSAFSLSKLTSVTFPAGLTYVNDHAFLRCQSLASVKFSRSLKTIGNYCFAYCPLLTNVELLNSRDLTSIGELAFNECSSLSLVSFPSSLESIGGWAFKDCSSLTSVVLTNAINLKSIDNNAFQSCTSLRSIDFTKPANLSYIGGEAFIGCSNLSSVVLPTNLETISSRCFAGCSSLTSVTLPSHVSRIETYAFQGCSSLTSVSFPKNLSVVGPHVFSDCSNLSSITWDAWNGNTTLDSSSFNKVCQDGGTVTVTNPIDDDHDSIALLNYLLENGGLPESWRLEDRALPEEVFKIDGDKIQGFKDEFLNDPTSPIYKDNYKNCNTLEIPARIRSTPGLACSDVPKFITKLTFAEGSIFNTTNSFTFAGWKSLILADFSNATSCVGFGTYFFRNDSSLTSIILPPGLNTISGQAFQGCASLTTIDLSNISSIDGGAFRDCTSLTTITLPSKLTSISKYAFYGCSNLKTIIWDSWKGDTSLNAEAFVNIGSSGTILVTNPIDDAHNSQALLNYLKENAGLPADWHI